MRAGCQGQKHHVLVRKSDHSLLCTLPLLNAALWIALQLQRRQWGPELCKFSFSERSLAKDMGLGRLHCFGACEHSQVNVYILCGHVLTVVNHRTAEHSLMT